MHFMRWLQELTNSYVINKLNKAIKCDHLDFIEWFLTENKYFTSYKTLR